MRRVTIALLALLFAPSAYAQDTSWLKAPSPLGVPVVNGWAGFYIGGQFGYSSANGDFTNTTQDPLAYALRILTLEADAAPSNWAVLGHATHSHASFGGFAGYNTQYEQLVLGAEANFNFADLSLTAPNSPISRRVTAGGTPYDVTVTGSGSLTNLDFGTLRARGGWAMGNFLPYAFAGLAVGHADLNISATAFGVQNPPLGCPAATNPPCVPFSFTGTAGKNGEWLYGFTVGAGLDVALTRNVFLRAEYEFVQFSPVDKLQVNVNTARGGLAVKF